MVAVALLVPTLPFVVEMQPVAVGHLSRPDRTRSKSLHSFREIILLEDEREPVGRDVVRMVDERNRRFGGQASILVAFVDRLNPRSARSSDAPRQVVVELL